MEKETRKPVTEKIMRRLIADSHRQQFAGVDYQVATFDMWQEWALTDDQLNEVQSSPDPGCECGFCGSADWR